MTQTNWGRAAGGEFSHQAVYYHAPDGYLAAVLPFIREGLARSEPVLVAVPPPAAGLLRAALGPDGPDVPGVTIADMAELGRNPGRIISAVWEFIDRHPGQPVRFLGQPFWPGRSAAEVREAIRHEALINLAFPGAPVAVLCPYDVAALPPFVVASADSTHPVICTATGSRRSPDYARGRVPRPAARPLARPPAAAAGLAYAGDLRPVRDFVTGFARRSGLNADEAADLVLAVGELAANTIRHTCGGGTVHAWRDPGEVICQVSDQGRISDPLVGRRRPPDVSGLGVWVVHQVCDLVELRSGHLGTEVRVHLRAGPAPGSRATGAPDAAAAR